MEKNDTFSRFFVIFGHFWSKFDDFLHFLRKNVFFVKISRFFHFFLMFWKRPFYGGLSSIFYGSVRIIGVFQKVIITYNYRWLPQLAVMGFNGSFRTFFKLLSKWLAA